MSFFKKKAKKLPSRNDLREISMAEIRAVAGGVTAEQHAWINNVFNGGGASSEHSAWVRSTMMQQ